MWFYEAAYLDFGQERGGRKKFKVTSISGRGQWGLASCSLEEQVPGASGGVALDVDLTAESGSGAGGGSGWLSICSCIQGPRASNGRGGCLLKKMHNLRVAG